VFFKNLILKKNKISFSKINSLIIGTSLLFYSSFAMAEYKVALMYPGTSKDLSWSNAVFDGAMSAKASDAEISLETVELLNDPQTFEQQGVAFAAQGYDLIIMAHGAMVDPAITVSSNFPNTKVALFPHHPGKETAAAQPNNLYWVDIAQHNANFFAGALAALMSENGSIGSLNGFEFPALTRQAETFHLGARCINPDIKFSGQYINTWTDTAISKAAALAMYGNGVDVILSATDSAVYGIIQAAAEMKQNGKQKWVVPSYYESQLLNPDVVLTSAIHGLSYATETLIKDAKAGKIGDKAFVDFNVLNNPEIGAPLYDNVKGMLSAEKLKSYDDLVSKVKAGSITIPDETTGNNTVGSVGSGGSVILSLIGCN
jgi:basic membrane protein A